MKILLDCSPAKIAAYTARYGVEFGQLRTPLTQYAIAPGVPWALDNGCFSVFHQARWERMLDQADESRPLFVTLPDIVCDAQRTAELFDAFHRRTQELPRALVLQNGIARVRIPWSELAAVFIGGDDPFKISPEAMAAARTAKMLGKWVHVGRVNTAARVRNWIGLADSIDGSGISQFDHMLEDCLAAIAGVHPQQAMELSA
jgi:hypothetical protein